MKGSIFSTLVLGAQIATAASPHIYVFDPSIQSPSSSHGRPLTPVAARLVLAQRVAVEDFHDADFSTPGVLDAINEYGVRTHLFDVESMTPKRALVYLEGHTEPSSLSQDLRSVEVSPTPDASACRGLFLDLARQLHPSVAKLADEELLAYIEDGKDTNFGSVHVAKSAEEFEQLLARLSQAGESVTGFFVPLSGGSDSATWGTYAIPGKESLLQKRQRPQVEAPLELEHGSASNATSRPSGSGSSLAKSTPLAGIFPGCFSSQEDCEKQTRKCNGHGGCYKKFTDADKPDKSPAKNCYTCQCEDEKTKSGSTIRWAGPACTKKDVSVEFWLIALFSVGMVFLVSFAIGTVWSMGDEELPSVIGAGVSGPVKRS